MINNELNTADNFILYTTPNGDVKLEVFIKDETLWLSQKMMTELFGVKEHTITYHLKEIYDSGELIDMATTRKIRVVRLEGNRQVTYINRGMKEEALRLIKDCIAEAHSNTNLNKDLLITFEND